MPLVAAGDMDGHAVVSRRFTDGLSRDDASCTSRIKDSRPILAEQTGVKGDPVGGSHGKVGSVFHHSEPESRGFQFFLSVAVWWPFWLRLP